MCRQPGGQDMCRCLQLDKHIQAVLPMRLENKQFGEVMRMTLDLVAAYVTDHRENQVDVATNSMAALVKLLWLPEYSTNAAKCLIQTVSENEELSTQYSGMLVQQIGRIALDRDQDDRHVALLHLLQTLLVVDNRPVAISQVQICTNCIRQLLSHWMRLKYKCFSEFYRACTNRLCVRRQRCAGV